MNESPWPTPPSAGYRGATESGAAGFPAGPAHDGAEAAQTRPMPIVPGVGGEDRDRGNSRPGSPPTRGVGQPGGPRPGHGDARVSGASRLDPPTPGGREGSPPSAPPAGSPAGEQAAAGGRPAARKKGPGRDLPAAIGVGLALGAVIVVSLFLYKPVFVGVIVVAVVVGLWELTSRLAEEKGIRAPLVPLAVGGAAMAVVGYLRGPQGAWAAMAITVLAVLVWRMTGPADEYLRDVTAAVFAAFYVPFLATFVALMLAADDGPWRVLTFLLLTVVSDTGAYAVGWRFGRHKLAPRISPGKTREGLLGAVSFAMVAGALCTHFLIDDGAWWQGLLLGLAASVSATLGDLGESMIKRDLGIKDMGSLLPGHGGIMDRLDSLLPTAPVVWLLLVAFVGST